jgi:hypothetical protein
MGSQYRSSLESMIHYVLAAPGAGKSAVAPHLRAFLPGSVILDWTRSWVPPKHWQALPSGRHHRPGLATSSWYGPLLTRSGRSAPSCSSVCTPQQLSDWPNGEWLLLDCADDERRTRLAPRRNPTQTEEAVADAASYRTLGLPVLDSTDLNPLRVATAIVNMIDPAASRPAPTHFPRGAWASVCSRQSGVQQRSTSSNHAAQHVRECPP